MDMMLGEIRLFAGNYAPNDWTLCNGDMLSISEYTALFSLIGTMWGGDGINTFAVPDLRGRVPIGPDGGTYRVGGAGGSETVRLSEADLPSHTHAFFASKAAATTQDPSDALLATVTNGTGTSPPTALYGPATLTHVAMDAQAIRLSKGAAGEHTNCMPSMALNFIIALRGNYPINPG